MAEIFVGLVVFSIVVFFVALIGHGLWLMAAAFFRAISGAKDEVGLGGQIRLGGQRCSACGHPTGLKDGVCGYCGHRSVQARLVDLKTTINQIGCLRENGRISDDQHVEVIRALVQMRREILSELNLGQSPAAAPAEGDVEVPSLSDDVLIIDDQPQELSRAAAESTPERPPISQPRQRDVSAPIEAEMVDAEVLEVAPGPEPVMQPVPAPAPFSPRRTFANMLQSFMEEKNIRWGELASGILIVGSAIGLVISLRTTLERLSEEIPYFPALLFMLGTVAIHAAGLYTLRRWNLRSTSRGVLIIATLLIPLSFASGIILSDKLPITSPFYILAVLIGVLGYGAITAFSARALFVEGWWRLVVVITGTSIGQLIINRLGDAEINWPPLLANTCLFAVPLVSYLIATLSQLSRVSRKKSMTPARASQTFTVLGVSVFALVVPLGMLAWGSVHETLSWLSPSLSVAASVVLGIGIAVHWRCQARTMTETRTVGTALAVFGGLLMLGTLFLAWPIPDVLIAVGTVTAVVLGLLAVVGQMPFLHAGAVAAATFAYLMVFHHVGGEFESSTATTGRDLIAAFLMGRSAVALLVPIGFALFAGTWLARRKRGPEAFAFLASAAGVAAISLLIALYTGFWSRVDANWTTPLLSIYAIATLVAAVLMRRQALTWTGSGLLLIALLHLLGWNQWFIDHLEQWRLAPDKPILVAVITHGLVVEFLAIIVWAWRSRGEAVENTRGLIRMAILQPLSLSGAISAALTVPFILSVGQASLGLHAGYAACIAIIWFIAGCIGRSPQLITAANAATALAISFAVAAFALRQPWLDTLRDLRHWQLQLSVLGFWCAASVALRLLMRRWPSVEPLFKPKWPGIDQLVLATLIITLAGIGTIGCWPGISTEMGITAPGSGLTLDSWHTHGYGVGSWVALACISLALILTLFERTTITALEALGVTTAIIPLLVSGPFESHQAVASALRWSFAIYCLVWIVAIAARTQIRTFAGRIFQPRESQAAHFVTVMRNTAMLLGMVPVVLLTSWAVLVVANGTTLGGPRPDTLFASFAPRALYGAPLVILVLCALICAVRDRGPSFAFLGSMFFQYFIALIILLPSLGSQASQSPEIGVSLVQWLGCGLAGYALVWLALGPWIEPGESGTGSGLLRLQLLLATLTVVLLAGWAFLAIFPTPGSVGSAAAFLGLWPSYLAAGLCLAALAWHFQPDGSQIAPLIVAVLCAFATLAAATASAYDQGNSWLSYHVLTAAWLVTGLASAAVACWRTVIADQRKWVRELAQSAVAIAGAVVVLVVRGCVSDPLNPWWTAGVCGGLFVLFAALALRGRNQIHAYASALIATFGATVVWSHVHGSRMPQLAMDLIYCNVVVASIVGIFWLLVEVWYQNERNQSFDVRFRFPPVHSSIACVASVTMLPLVVGGAILSTLAEFAQSGSGSSVGSPWGIAAIASFGVLLASMLWDRRTLLVTIALYGWGLVGIAMILSYLEEFGPWGPDGTVVGGCLLGAAYVALTGHLWKWGANLAQWAVRVRIPQPVAKLEQTSRWLPTFNATATVLISFLGFVTVLTSEFRGMRMAAAFAPLMLAYGLACLAQQQRRFTMQCFALVVACLAAVFMGWADVRPVVESATPLAYASRLLIVLAGVTLLYAVVVLRWIGAQNNWYDAVRKTSAFLTITTVITLKIVLAMELVEFQPGVGAPIAAPEVIVISIMLLGFIVALLSMALMPGRDPLELTETGRTGYVYAAQTITALLFAHVYLAKPMLFEAGLKPYWPYLVILLAFGSVAFGEICHRRGWRVIGEPMQRTGGLLPLLPALGAWAFSDTSYPLVLFFAGLIYVFLSITRRSFTAALAAAILGNGALWALLADQGYQLQAQPQFWMIPPAFSVLVAAHINRRRLGANTLTAIRYICVMIIYLSSAGEMFMTMLLPEGPEGWLRPIILASLSVAGIFAGIVLRIRAFLYLGASFLLMSTVGMVWNAARLVEHTWPWWAFGISLGLLILVLFGIFEKNRREIQHFISRLQQWEP